MRIANLEMERALRVVTVERGVDPRGLVLVAFGGAGPMHAVALAGSLGMRGVLAPPAAGVLSALGLAAGERRRDAARTVMLRGPELTAEALGDALARALEELGGAPAGSRVERALDVRYRGQSFELTVGCDERPDPASVAAHFAAEHERRYGYADGEASIEVVNVRVATASDGADLEGVGEPAAAADEELERSVRRARFAGEWHEAAVFGGTPPAGFEVAGPAVLEPGEATLVVPPGWLARAGEHGIVRVDRLGAGNAPTTPRAR